MSRYDYDIQHPPTGQTQVARPGSGRSGLVGLALGASATAMALVAGLSFTFAVAVMPNLAGVDDRTFVLITQRFNENPWFPLTFTMALVVTVLAIVLQAALARGPAVRWAVAALALYVVALAITGGVHIPLNVQISEAGNPDSITDIAAVRDRFEAPWVMWNIVRTLACIAAFAALSRALLLHGRRTAA